MARPFWLRPLRLAEKPAESVPRAAVRGEPFDLLLRSAATRLQEAMNADRAGVWAEETLGEPSWAGYLAQVETLGPVSERSGVNAFESFPVEFTDANSPIEFFAPVFPVGPREFFEGISTAVGMPLKVGERIVGALLAGSTRPGRLAGRDVLESLGAEIAISLYANRLREQHERVHEALHLREDVEHLLAAGASSEDVLRKILSAAVQQTRAQFAGVAERRESSLRWEVICGAPPVERMQQSLFTLATAVFLDRESVVHDLANGAQPGLSVAAMPLHSSGGESLVLFAGYLCGERIPLATLEGFRAMAGNARATANARDSQAAYQALFESSPQALILADRQGRVLKANRLARELLLWKSDFGPEVHLSECLSPATAEEFKQWLARADAGIRVAPVQVRLENGTEVRAGLRQTLAGSGQLLLAFEEGSRVEMAEREWKRTEAELRNVLDAVQCGVVLAAADGRIRFVNPQFGALLNLDARILRASETYESLAQEIDRRFRHGGTFRKAWNSFAAGSGNATHEDLELKAPPGRIIERYARPVMSGEGRPIGWMELLRDVTRQRQLQSKLLQAEKMASVGTLASGIAHELNNPLTSIMGYAQLLLRDSLPENRGEAKLIFEEAERARRIVKNLLSFARPAKQERARADINEIARRTVALRAYELKLQNITVLEELDSSVPPTMADPHQLQQVILNLLVNAEHAVSERGVAGVIELRTRKISSQRISIEVSDNGPGISPEAASHLFDPFFTTKAPGVGTGLGLAIVRSIVEQHEGQVRFENLAGGGAKFIVELPLVPAPAAKALPSGGEAIACESRFKAANVLVVEDEPTVAHLIADVLAEDGHHVEAVRDGQEGLLRVSRRRYDLVICDLRMPKLDGPAFYDALVRAGNAARQRILFITGDTLGRHTMEFLQSRRLPYLAKPFLVEELKAAVYSAMEPGSGALASAEAGG